jgi:hypothetical protein
MLGVVGWSAERGDLDYWMGSPHRGNGLMTEAVVDRLTRESFVGNAASVSVARGTGVPLASDDRAPQPGWPS